MGRRGVLLFGVAIAAALLLLGRAVTALLVDHAWFSTMGVPALFWEQVIDTAILQGGAWVLGTLFAFVLVCGAVIYLRHLEPHAPRPFRVPYVPLVPVLGIVFCLVLIAGMTPATWVRLVVWLAFGYVIYFTYSRHHSRLLKR